jgi:hypothetical protein
VEYPITPIKFPSLRFRIKDAIEQLASPIYQRRIWIENRGPQGMESCFEYVWDCIIEDSHLDEGLNDHNSQEIGVLFFSQQEAKTVSDVVQLIDVYSTDIQFEWENPLIYTQWPLIVEKAQKAYITMIDSERKAFFIGQDIIQIAQACIEEKRGANFVLKRHKQKLQITEN